MLKCRWSVVSITVLVTRSNDNRHWFSGRALRGFRKSNLASTMYSSCILYLFWITCISNHVHCIVNSLLVDWVIYCIHQIKCMPVRQSLGLSVVYYVTFYGHRVLRRLDSSRATSYAIQNRPICVPIWNHRTSTIIRHERLGEDFHFANI